MLRGIVAERSDRELCLLRGGYIMFLFVAFLLGVNSEHLLAIMAGMLASQLYA
jgi:hypothetical protein